VGVCGEIAAAEAPGPGSLQFKFLDALYSLKKQDIHKRLKIKD